MGWAEGGGLPLEIELDRWAEGLDSLGEELPIGGAADVVADEEVDAVTRFSDWIERCARDEGHVGDPIVLLPGLEVHGHEELNGDIGLGGYRTKLSACLGRAHMREL